MADKKTDKDSERLDAIFENAVVEFSNTESAVRNEREQCLIDRRFCSIAGAQWEGPLNEQYENKPRVEVNKILRPVMRVINEKRNNPVTVDYIPRDGKDDNISDLCDGLYRADEQDSNGDEAYDNAFDEAVKGGIGAWRLTTKYEDEEGENDYQRICLEPIFDADSCVFFDLQAKRQDKKDAKKCWVLSAMTHEAYEDEFNDSPASWPKSIHKSEFDWNTPDVVYVAEYFEIEDFDKIIFVFEDIEGNEIRHHEDELKDDPSIREKIEALGGREIRQRKIKDKKVHKYIMSGGGILEDCGYIAGKNIPIIPLYGIRWFVDNVERAMGMVRPAKDAQRVKNAQVSKLLEISALSSVEKPILTPEQIVGHESLWAEDNIKDYPYMLVNPITDAEGNQVATGPIGYTKPPQIPPALAALLQITEQDLKDILGDSDVGEELPSNISGKAVELIQNRIDMQSYIFLNNFSKAMKRCGEVWLSMAKEVYVEDNRMMKSINQANRIEMIKLSTQEFEDGQLVTKNSLKNASMDVVAEVGPSSDSRRAATVRALTGMMQVSTDPEDLKVLSAAALMNIEGEGLSGVQEYYRKKLVRMGVEKPTPEDEQELAAELQANQQPDPNAVYLQAEAMKAEAEAQKAQADTVKILADAELKTAQTEKAQAETAETLASIDRDDLKIANDVAKEMVSVQPLQ